MLIDTCEKQDAYYLSRFHPCFGEGWHAYLDDKKVLDNPYAPMTEQADEWDEGYEWARSSVETDR